MGWVWGYRQKSAGGRARVGGDRLRPWLGQLRPLLRQVNAATASAALSDCILKRSKVPRVRNFDLFYDLTYNNFNIS